MFLCSICREQIDSQNDLIGSIPCGHVFHLPCLEEWFKRSESCPHCRKSGNIMITRLYFEHEETSSRASTSKFDKDNADFEIRLREAKLKTFVDKLSKLKTRNLKLIDQIRTLSEKNRFMEEENREIKVQKNFLLSRLENFDKVKQENIELEKRVKSHQLIEKLIVNNEMIDNMSPEDMDELSKLTSSAFSIILVTLRSQIKTYVHENEHLMYEINKLRAHSLSLASDNKKLSDDLSLEVRVTNHFKESNMWLTEQLEKAKDKEMALLSNPVEPGTSSGLVRKPEISIINLCGSSSDSEESDHQEKKRQCWSPISPERRVCKLKKLYLPTGLRSAQLGDIRTQPGSSDNASTSISSSPRIKKMKIKTDRGKK